MTCFTRIRFEKQHRLFHLVSISSYLQVARCKLTFSRDLGGAPVPGSLKRRVLASAPVQGGTVKMQLHNASIMV